MHRLLRRQLKRAFGSLEGVPEELAPFLEMVERAYIQSDQDRALVEQSLEMASDELVERNRQLKSDINARIMAEEAATENAARLQAVLESLPDVVYLYEGGHMVPLQPGDSYPLQLDAAGHQRVVEVIESGSAQAWEVAIPLDGELRRFEVRAVAAGALGALLLQRDVTELRQIRTQLAISERMASVGTLAAGVAHEVNNPLAFVIGNLEYLRECLHTTELSSPIDDALVGARRVRDIVRDLKGFARGPEGGPQAVELSRVIHRAVGLAQLQLRQTATLQIDIDATAVVRAEANRLEQVILNLLINAGQAFVTAHPATNRIQVRLSVEDDQAVIIVADNGCGMSAATQAQAFDLFFTTKPAGQGTGLGLSICRNLIERCDGTLVLESQLGVGTTFTLRMPLTAQQVSATAKPAPSRSLDKRLRVLIIDDEPAVARAAARLLRGHRPDIAVGGPAGLVALEQSSYDVVLCDLLMPELTGMDVFSRATAADPRLAQRFVFMTGGAFTPTAKAFLADCRAPVVDKPFDAVRLRDAIATRRAGPVMPAPW